MENGYALHMNFFLHRIRFDYICDLGFLINPIGEDINVFDTAKERIILVLLQVVPSSRQDLLVLHKR
jgi:hypothetical protein